jgi:hypothetical protein
MMRTRSRRSTLWVVAAALVVGAACALAAGGDGTIVLKPGQNLQDVVARHPEGTRFRLEPGLYRQQTIHPKSRQKFIGQDGVVLSGAMELNTWTRQAGYWRSGRLPPPLPFHGQCSDGGELCLHREDLFFNDRLFKRVGSLDELGPRRWYYADRRAYLAQDPTGQLVELGVTPLAFGGDAQGVVLENLVVEKYASDAQEGAIYTDHARGWTITNVTARWNHGAGLSFGPETSVYGGSFSHNGQIGIVGSGGAGSRIQGVEIAFNNYAGYNPRWEAGGTKFWETTGLIVRHSCIHHNAGPGLWTDNDNVDTIFEKNKVFRNANEGIKHEISYRAIIRHNLVAHNATSRHDNWLWGSQILIQDSSDVEVYRNLVEPAGAYGNGIGVIYQDRGSGAFGPWRSVNNSVHHNTIVHRRSRGRSGIVTDTGDDRFWRDANNSFDRNIYIVAEKTSEHWTFNDLRHGWDGIRGLGYESNGELIVERPAKTELSCDR